MNIAGTGLSGLVGSRIREILSSSHNFENWSLDTGVDITDKQSIEERIAQTNASWILHLAAYTDVQGAEKEKSLGIQSSAWRVNVDATAHIVELSKKYNKRLLFVDTDYAFDGTKQEYTEEDPPNPQSWYGQTKTEGASLVMASGGIVIRIANPYRANPVGKTDFVHKMIARLEENLEIVAPTDQLFVPTFIDDIARAVGVLLEKNASGMYHVVGDQALSPYDAAKIIATTYGYSETLVKPTNFHDFFSTKAKIPQHASLKNDKIKKLGVSMCSFHEGIVTVRFQEVKQ